MLYNTLLTRSDKRYNILRWINIKSGSLWLLIGDKCSKLVEYLKSINAQTDFYLSLEDWEKNDRKYDYILLYDLPYTKEVISVFLNCLNSNGQLIILAENPLGTNTLGGYADTQTGIFFDSIRKEKRNCISLRNLKRLIDNSCSNMPYKFYYPYPTNDFAEMIFSDSFFPKASDLHNSSYPVSDKRINLFNMQELYERADDAGILLELMNSFMVIIGKDVTPWDFVKYSTEREEKYQTLTKIQNGCVVLKTSLTDDGKEHLNNLITIEKELSKKFEGTLLKANRCWKSNDGISLEFLKGISLSDLLDDALLNNNSNKFWNLIDQYMNNIKKVYPGEAEAYLDIDLIFQNIIVDNGVWNVLDYEWTFNENFPVDFVIYRAIHYYFYQSNICRENIELEQLYRYCGIEHDRIQTLAQMEYIFQKKIGAPICENSDAPDQMSVEDFLETKKQAKERLQAMDFWKARADERMDVIHNLEKRLSELEVVESDMNYITASRSWKFYKKLIHWDDHKNRGSIRDDG